MFEFECNQSTAPTDSPILSMMLAIVLIVFFVLVSGGTKASKRFLPKAQAGMIKTFRELAGDRAPFFLLDQARQISSLNYRLAIPVPIVIIGDAATARSILSNPKNDKPLDMMKTFDITLGGTNMFTQPNEKAGVTRGKLSKAFTSKEVRGRMKSICKRQCDNWIEASLKPAINAGSAIDPCHEMLHLAFRIVCETIFEYDACEEECDLFLQHGLITATEFGFKQMMNPLRPVLGKLLAERATAYDSVEWVQQFGLMMLKEFQMKKKQGRNAKGCNTVINLIDSDPKYATNKEKLPELMLWLFAGHDTVGLSMGTLLWHLAQNQSEMDYVREAMRSVTNESEQYKLKEIQNVIKESNRLQSVTANISMRKLGEDMTTSDGYFIPKGTTAFLPQHLPNHDPLIYKNPEQFLPSRWNNPTKEMMDAHMQFALGPRSCPGLSLAKAEMDQIIPTLILDYSFELVEIGSTKFFITLKPVGALLRPKYAS